MKPETQKSERDWQFTERSKRIGKGVASVALTGAVALGISNIASAERDAKPVPTQTDIADHGDTLWDMTDDVKNVEDKRDVIDWAENHSPDLADGSLDSGDEVVMPVDAKDIR